MYDHCSIKHFFSCFILLSISVSPLFSQNDTSSSGKTPDPWAIFEAGPSLLGDRILTGSHLFECPVDKISSPELTEALTSYEKLWDFLTSPETPYCERLVAAKKGQHLFDLEKLPVLQDTLEELGYAATIVRSRPGIASASIYLGDYKPTMVLGHHWTPPTERVPWPLTAEDFETVPWPWQVSTVLSCLREVLEQRVWTFEDRKIRYQQMLARPCNTRLEALGVAKASHWLDWFKPTEEDWPMLMQVLASWRNLILNPDFKSVNRALIEDIALLNKGWNETEYRWVPQAILLEILEKSPNEATKMYTVHDFFRLYFVTNDRRHFRLPIPATLTLASLDYVQKSRGSVDDRFYAAKLLVTLFKQAPFKVNLFEYPCRIEEDQLKAMLDWLELQRPVLEADAVEEGPRLKKARLRLPDLDHCGQKSP